VSPAVKIPLHDCSLFATLRTRAGQSTKCAVLQSLRAVTLFRHRIAISWIVLLCVSLPVPCSLLLLCTSGKYLTIPRTEGISTTDIVGRMLLMTRDHHATTAAVSSPAAAGGVHADGHGVSALPSTPSLGKLASSEKLTSTADEGAEAGVSADVVAAVGKCLFEHCRRLCTGLRWV
jgi:hypothetical protein